jgi:pantoate--beta-alanine ligase
MYLYKQVTDIQAHLQAERGSYQTIGFVPTMGALHAGHISLINTSLAENQLTVCSIFVNPTQFNQAEDLEKYPRMPALDIARLADAGCHIVFLPEVEVIYPPGLETRIDIDLNGLDLVMEGAHRPGHFAGVVQVVNRLLDIVKPHRLYMGQKDYQQLCIIRRMLEVQQSPVELVMVPTVREADGLAMSSRNMRLNPEERAQAAAIYKILQHLRQAALKKGASFDSLTQDAFNSLQAAGFRPEYVSIVHGISLQPLSGLPDNGSVVACVAAWLGEIRLIDNLIIREK